MATDKAHSNQSDSVRHHYAISRLIAERAQCPTAKRTIADVYFRQTLLGGRGSLDDRVALRQKMQMDVGDMVLGGRNELIGQAGVSDQEAIVDGIYDQFDWSTRSVGWLMSTVDVFGLPNEQDDFSDAVMRRFRPTRYQHQLTTENLPPGATQSAWLSNEFDSGGVCTSTLKELDEVVPSARKTPPSVIEQFLEDDIRKHDQYKDNSSVHRIIHDVLEYINTPDRRILLENVGMSLIAGTVHELTADAQIVDCLARMGLFTHETHSPSVAECASVMAIDTAAQYGPSSLLGPDLIQVAETLLSVC